MGAECSDCGTDLRFRGNTWPMEAFCEPCELRAQVARLEGELAEAQTKYDRLLFTHDEVTLPMLYEADERLKVLEAAIRAKDAALENVPVEPANIPWLRWEPGAIKRFWKWYNVTRRAALSPDAGKDWPEVREQVLRTGNRLLEEIHRRAMPSPPYTAIDEFRAALDALKGVK